jgi:membrane-associated phospholipid phosphatase
VRVESRLANPSAGGAAAYVALSCSGGNRAAIYSRSATSIAGNVTTLRLRWGSRTRVIYWRRARSFFPIGCGEEIMSSDDPMSAGADLSVLGNLRSGLVGAVGVTDFGDQAVVLPLAVGIALIFALSGWRRGALAWTAAIGGTLGLVLFLKLRFVACDHFLAEARPGNPSGHTAAAAAIYGGLVAIVMRSIWDNKRWALPFTVAIAVFLAVVIGASRLILDTHSMAEVVVGGAIGVGGAASFVVLAGPPLRSVRMLRVVAMGLLIILMLYGFRLPAEAAIKSVATNIWPFSECI